MTVKVKASLIAFFVVCAGVGYGVYWWHELCLDHQALETLPYQGPLLDKARTMIHPRTLNGDAGAFLDRQDEYHRIRILEALSIDEEPSIRYFAIASMKPLREHPRIRAALARSAVDDEDVRNRAAARKILKDQSP